MILFAGRTNCMMVGLEAFHNTPTSAHPDAHRLGHPNLCRQPLFEALHTSATAKHVAVEMIAHETECAFALMARFHDT